jgi:hypothetical protein
MKESTRKFLILSVIAIVVTAGTIWKGCEIQTAQAYPAGVYTLNSYQDYRFTEKIAPAPKELPPIKGQGLFYHWNRKGPDGIPRCEWSKSDRPEGGWELNSPQTSKRYKKCGVEALYTWPEALQYYLENLVNAAKIYGDDYEVYRLTRFGLLFDGDHRFIDDRVSWFYFEKFFKEKILKSPELMKALVTWVEPYVRSAIGDIRPIEREMYKAALVHGLEYLESVDIKQEERYLKVLEEDDEGEYFDRQREDGTSYLRNMEVFIYERLMDGTPKKALSICMQFGIKIIDKAESEEEVKEAKLEFIKEGLMDEYSRWKVYYYEGYLPKCQTLAFLGRGSECPCVSPPPEPREVWEYLQLSFKELTELKEFLQNSYDSSVYDHWKEWSDAKWKHNELWKGHQALQKKKAQEKKLEEDLDKFLAEVDHLFNTCQEEGPRSTVKQCLHQYMECLN